jgi:hypothetical protein
MQNSETNKNYQNGIPVYNLKVGDMISTDHGFGLITKITGRKYYYKVLHGRDCVPYVQESHAQVRSNDTGKEKTLKRTK